METSSHVDTLAWLDIFSSSKDDLYKNCKNYKGALRKISLSDRKPHPNQTQSRELRCCSYK